MKIVIATANKGKRREICGFLKGLELELLFPDAFPGFKMPPETGGTFAENALIKARAFAAFTGLATLADDSGLEVDFLGGAPGIHSARYAVIGSGTAQNHNQVVNASDDDNINRLLKELDGVPPEKRTARFRTVIALVIPGAPGTDEAKEQTFDGVLNGRITERRAGAGGFGYDPVFFIPASGLVAAELSIGEKGEISHRGMALKGLKKWLEGGGLLGPA